MWELLGLMWVKLTGATLASGTLRIEQDKYFFSEIGYRNAYLFKLMSYNSNLVI